MWTDASVTERHQRRDCQNFVTLFTMISDIEQSTVPKHTLQLSQSGFYSALGSITRSPSDFHAFLCILLPEEIEASVIQNKHSHRQNSLTPLAPSRSVSERMISTSPASASGTRVNLCRGSR